MQRDGQPIRADGPERHLIEKKGTPTMGGVLILLALTISTLLWADLRNGYVWAVLFVHARLRRGRLRRRLPEAVAERNTKGVSARGKLIVQVVIGLIAAIWIIGADARRRSATELTVPVFKDVLIPLGFALPAVRHAGDAGRVQRGEPDRRAGRAGDRADHHRRRACSR